ncbi:hypothetical protein H2200_007756 [Cladophialophora chaetospira]|uniref:Phospholipase D-like domain-containing protein n=1 Tax=Cladophialophora chaetospira TaxID=386627 RepID=A0AA39CGW3_9EURO|nr:hypothetical protein H2200_007756 [Cladophialophora chaetospira]
MDTIVDPEELAVPFGLDLAIECHYPASSAKVTPTNVQRVDDGQNEWQSTASSLLVDPETSVRDQQASGFHVLNLEDTVLAPDFANLEDYFNWNDPVVKDLDLLNRPTNYDTVVYDQINPLSIFGQSTPSTNHAFQMQQSRPSLVPTIPIVPSTMVRSLKQRPKPKVGAHRIANLMLHTLKSYPIMMMRNALPPFIHPHVVSSDFGNIHMEPLINCISLVNMISAGVRGSRKLFWKNVRLECERLCGELLSLSKWDLLAAMQALAIYIFIRLDEGETDHNNFDFLLLRTVTVLAQQSTSINVLEPASRSYGLETSWQNWIYEESCRRLCVVYQIMNLLVYFDPAALCDHDANLILGPLPTRKQLWEAADEFAWVAESAKEPGIETLYGLAVNGDLVRLDGAHLRSDEVLPQNPSHIGSPSSSATNWEGWCAGMDGFGGLVMLAASLFNTSEPEAIHSLALLPNAEVKIFKPNSPTFHPKAWLFKHEGDANGVVIIGSSNMTASGISREIEWNHPTSDPGAITEFEKTFDDYWSGRGLFGPENVLHYDPQNNDSERGWEALCKLFPSSEDEPSCSDQTGKCGHSQCVKLSKELERRRKRILEIKKSFKNPDKSGVRKRSRPSENPWELPPAKKPRINMLKDQQHTNIPLSEPTDDPMEIDAVAEGHSNVGHDVEPMAPTSSSSVISKEELQYMFWSAISQNAEDDARTMSGMAQNRSYDLIQKPVTDQIIADTKAQHNAVMNIYNLERPLVFALAITQKPSIITMLIDMGADLFWFPFQREPTRHETIFHVLARLPPPSACAIFEANKAVLQSVEPNLYNSPRSAEDIAKSTANKCTPKDRSFVKVLESHFNRLKQEGRFGKKPKYNSPTDLGPIPYKDTISYGVRR